MAAKRCLCVQGSDVFKAVGCFRGIKVKLLCITFLLLTVIVKLLKVKLSFLRLTFSFLTVIVELLTVNVSFLRITFKFLRIKVRFRNITF